MGFFDGLNKAKERGNSDRFKPGIYPAIRVDELKFNRGHNGERFILVGTVLAPATRREDGVDPDPVGSQCSWSAQVDGKYAEIGLGEVKALLRIMCEAQGRELPEDVESLAEAAVGPDQPFRGAVIGTEAWHHETKSGYRMTVHAWKAAEGEYDASAHPAPTQDGPPPAPTPPAPTQSPEDRAKAAGYIPNPADTSGTWWYKEADPSAPQKTLADFAA